MSAGKKTIAILLATLIVVLATTLAWQWMREGSNGLDRLAEARYHHSLGQIPLAEKKAWQAWNENQTLDEAALFAAEMAFQDGRYEAAVQYASHVRDAVPQQKLIALQLTATALHQALYRYSDAERAYRGALELDPTNVEAMSGLANLLGTCARRTEAIPLVLSLVEQGKASDLLMLLAREDSIVNDRQSLERARRAMPDDPLPIVGLAWHAAETGSPDQAIAMLRQALTLNSTFAAARAALLKIAASEERWQLVDQFDMAQGDTPKDVARFAEPWIARGRSAEHSGDARGAIRCYAEAARLSPDSKIANARLAYLLHSIDEPQQAVRFESYLTEMQTLYELQDQVFFSGQSSDDGRLFRLIQQYIAVGRLWEAMGWCQIAIASGNREHRIAAQYKTLQGELRGAPLQLVASAKMPVADWDLSNYPLPKSPTHAAADPLAAIASVDPSSRSAVTDAQKGLQEPAWHEANFRLCDDTQAAQLHFKFHNGTEGSPQRKMYEFTGGGIGVIDFDADGRPDIILTQGKPWPLAEQLGSPSDELLRNIDGVHFEKVSTDLFRLGEDGFGQGVTVGDIDADGFPDAYIAQIGQNRLLHNNGDGTFSDVTIPAKIVAEAWTTSCVMADLNGDTLPDIYDVNYLQGPDLFERVCTDSDGHPALCLPGDFESADDCLWINDGQGGFTNGTSTSLSVTPHGKGLGALAFDADGSGRLSLMVANDTTPNFWFTPQLQGDGSLLLSEQGTEAGLALDANGKAKGCMGIAMGDADLDGRLDLLITNFFNEGSTLYLNRGSGHFTDQTQSLGLLQPSLNTLGFGTQFIDVDLDGRSELFVANGHIDDLQRRKIPYEMQAQLFAFREGRFHVLKPSDDRAYFRQSKLGRAVARLDWNGDGRDDLLVGHLNSEYALLTNCSVDSGNWISIRLVGTQSNREAIGTTVDVRCGPQRWTSQIAAGDGYQASNERRLVFGIGSERTANQIHIRWPSGTEQDLANIPAGSRLLIVEPQK